ncbi:MAG TPA: acetate kinase [Propionibacteriaceae bacterium]|nr:acetate kinase [Propionibacteriaceae bacterium]
MPTPILVLNCGSSSIKYQVIDVEDESRLASGLLQKIGLPDSSLEHTTDGMTHRIDRMVADHRQALELVVSAFGMYGPALSDVVAVGHRAVHGGEAFRHPVRIDDEVIEKLQELSPLAPLHNPPGIAGIEAAMAELPDVPHVAVFDTAFFSTLPAEAYTYAIDADIAKRYSVRKYGFHGTSHKYVSERVAELLERPYEEVDQIVCHLGNGASISAIRGGVAVDTSMGLTPLQGLVMGTRSGDVDPGLHAYLAREAGMSVGEIDRLLNTRSGIAGLTGGSSDFRDLATRIEAGDAAAKLAYDVYIHRLVSYIGSYLAILGGIDAITFTAGVGENDDAVRESVCDRLAPLGFLLDDEANKIRSKEPRRISQPDSPIQILVVPTNEELAMARETQKVISA